MRTKTMTRPMTGQPETDDELHAATIRANVEEYRERKAAGITRADVMAVVEDLGTIPGVRMPWADTTEAIADVGREYKHDVIDRLEAHGYEVRGELEGYEDGDVAYLRIAVEGGEADR